MKNTKTFYLTIFFVNFLFTITHSQIMYNSTDFASVNDSFMVSKVNLVQLAAIGIITIEGENIESVFITNVQGQLIKRVNQKNQKIVIDLSGQSQGLYFVQVKNEKGMITDKFVIK